MRVHNSNNTATQHWLQTAHVVYAAHQPDCSLCYRCCPVQLRASVPQIQIVSMQSFSCQFALLESPACSPVNALLPSHCECGYDYMTEGQPSSSSGCTGNMCTSSRSRHRQTCLQTWPSCLPRSLRHCRVAWWCHTACQQCLPGHHQHTSCTMPTAQLENAARTAQSLQSPLQCTAMVQLTTPACKEYTSE